MQQSLILAQEMPKTRVERLGLGKAPSKDVYILRVNHDSTSCMECGICRNEVSSIIGICFQFHLGISN